MRAPLLLLPVLLVACDGKEGAPPNAPPAPSTTVAAATPSASATTATATTAAPEGTPPAASAGTSDGANVFAFRLFGKAKSADKNVFLGPTSLRAALSMATLGAKGATASELVSALSVESEPGKIAEAAKKENGDWIGARGTGAELYTANRLFGEKTYPLKADFNAKAESGFGAKLEALDFRGNPEGARGTVNKWVVDQTKNKIPDLLPKGSVTKDTRLILANAVYFKASWEMPFTKGLTKDEAFYPQGDSKGTLAVPTMHRYGTMRANVFPGGKVAELRYGNTDLAMDIVVPDDKSGLEALEANLDEGKFQEWTMGLMPKTVNLSLPKFTFSWGGSVADSLKQLGVKTAFGPGADFTGIADPKNPKDALYIDNVFHKSFVSVDESGTEAAAASAVVMGVKSAIGPDPSVIEVKADHPFLFVIRDVKKGRVLFIGHLRDPKAS
jgi:serpin B